MIKQSKRAISILVIAVFILSLVPFSVMAAADSEVIIRYTDSATMSMISKGWMRGGSYESNSYSTATSLQINNSTGQNKKLPFLHFDISEYIKYLLGNDAEITLGIQNSATESYDVYLFIGDHVTINDDSTVTTKMSMSYVLTQGIVTKSGTAYSLNTSSGDLIHVGTFEGSNNSNPQTFTKDKNANMTAANVLSAVGNSGWVTFIFNPTYADGGNGNLVVSDDDTYLQIKYNSQDVASDDDTLASIVEEFTWANVSSELQTSVTSATELPSGFKGASIAWTAREDNVIDSNGNIIQSSELKENVTLIATFTYGDAEPQEKEFTVTIAKKPPKTVTIPFINASNTRDESGDKFFGLYTGDTNHLNAVRVRDEGQGNIIHGYFQANLKGYEEILQNPSTEITFNLECGGGGSYPAVDYQLVLFPDAIDNGYNHTTISHNYAKNKGMQNAANGVVLYTDNDGKAASRADLSLELNAQTLNTGIDGMLTFGLLPLKTGITNTTGYYYPLRETSGITISYYEEEIEEDAYFAELEDDFEWANITADSQNALVNDLPNYFKGASVTWTSTNNKVNPNGTLNVTGIAADTLTATVSYKGLTFTSEEFPVTVCDGNITFATHELAVEGTNATASIKVVNGTDKDVSYQLYIAVYNDDEMTALFPETLPVDKGSVAEEEYTKTIEAGSKVKFFVWAADGITPVTASAEK